MVPVWVIYMWNMGNISLFILFTQITEILRSKPED